MKLTRRHVVIIVLACLALGLFIGHKTYLAMRRHLQHLDEQIYARQAEYQAAQREIERNKVFVERWQEVGSFVNQPVTERQTEFTSYLQLLRTGLDFDFRGLGAPEGRTMETNPKFQILQYQLDFVADLTDLVEFLERLDRSERLLWINIVQINRKELGRWEYSYGAGRPEYVMNLPSSKKDMLSVVMTVSTPAVQQATTEATVWETTR